MLRADTTGGGAYYAAWVSPGGGVTVDYRDTDGLLDNIVANLTATTPAWLEVARSGDTFTAYTSSDGTTWTPVIGSSEVLPNLEGTILAGVAVSSDNPGAVSTATFQDVGIASSAPVPPNLCPTGWECNDIGFPTPAGNQSYQEGTWTVQGGGGDISSTSDSFRFISESQETDGTVSADVVSQSDTNPYAKSGVMVRVSTSDTSAYYGVFVTPANGILVQYRAQEAGGTSQVAVSGNAPTYLEISRSGDTYTAYGSSDGVNWDEIAGSTASVPTLVGTLQAGVAVCSHDPLNLNTTVFEAVTISGTTGNGSLPSLWSDQDIGNPAPAGSASYGDGVFSVQGGGSDIWGAADQFNYVSQPLSGDTSVVARVTSQTPTDPWAKAGVMIKQSATAGAPYAMVAVTPDDGVVFQYGFNSSVTALGGYSLPNGWVRLDRSGDVFTAYDSTDGFNWVEIDQVDITMSSVATVGLFVTSHDPGALSTVTFANVTVTPSGGRPLPSPWANTDVGSPDVPGSSSYANGTFTVNGAGSDIWGTADQFQYAYQPLTGNASIVAEVTSQTATDPWAKAGVMIKQSTTTGDPYALVAVTPGNGVNMEYGFDANVSGGSYSFPNAWLKLTRTANTFTAYDSPDGSTWTEVGSATISMATDATIGLFVSSHNSGTLGTATFSNVSVSATGGGALPSPWANTDVGSPQIAGSSSYANGTFTVNGAGSDIWGTADQFQYAYQPLTGNASIVAEVTSQTATDPWAKAGVMIKQSTTTGDPYALVAVTPANGVVMQYGFNSQVTGGSYAFPNAWLKLTRTGSTFTTYDSPDGSTWTEVGSATISMATDATIGLFVSSHNPGTLGTATFANVTVTPSGGGPLPSPWSNTDVGSPQIAGSSSYANGTFTVNGAGSDIWGTADQFQYAYQPLTGNASIVAEVTSQTATDPWAKAGVMIKQSTTTGDPYALVAVTPGNGVNMEYGFDANVSGGSYSFPNAWLKLTRTGSTFTTYSSPDGSTWTEVGSATISMATDATIGLFVTSHNPGTLGTATFANVTVTPSGGGPLPSPWANTDVGSPQIAGSSSYANGTFTVNGAGSDIWGTADQFQYAYQPLTGNASIVAEVTSQTATDPWAKAGVMIKQSTTTGDPYALVAVTPANGVVMQYGFNSQVTGGSYAFPNAWLKLTRTGSTFTTYSSPDGSTWTEVGSATISMATNATIGLFVCSHNANLLGTATFANVTVTTT